MRASLRTALVCAALLPCDAMASDQARAPATSVQAPGEDLTNALRQAFAKRFALAGIPVAFSAWDGRLATLQQHEAAGGSEPDVLLMNDTVALAACREGLLATLDRAALGLPGDGADAQACGLPAFQTALVLAWDKTRDPTPPGWPDFWDVARYPGKRGLPRQSRGTLEIALMADGVAPADIYRVLGSAGGVDRAFHRLEQLRPYVVWWTDGVAARKALLAGAVMMTAAPASYGSAGNTTPIGQQWTEALAERLSWAVPTRAPDQSAAWTFLRMQQLASWQAAVTGFVPVVGLAPGVQGAVSDDLLARTAVAPHRAERMLSIDDAFWRDHPELSHRFEAWVSQAK